MTPRRLAAFLVVCIALAFVCRPLSAQTLKADKILILKEKRQLFLMKDGKALKVYRISLGWNPEGPKTRRGDGRTPEGTYTIDAKNSRSKYHLALHVSYPNAADRARAGGADPGGNIMIHGLPNGHGSRWQSKQLTDWTAGCIALSDSEIEEIWRAVPVGTVVEIQA
jgi:murein L,D-transpeptidase YafK